VTYTVSIQPWAEREVEEICEYLDREAPHLTEAWLDGYARSLTSLTRMPHRCALARESPSGGRELRQLLYHSFRIVFTIVGDDVRILHVRHHARDTLKP
jgi:plasmid stabilization system protein ParE